MSSRTVDPSDLDDGKPDDSKSKDNGKWMQHTYLNGAIGLS